MMQRFRSENNEFPDRVRTRQIITNRKAIARILKEVQNNANEFLAKKEGDGLFDVDGMAADYDDVCRPMMRRMFALVASARDGIMIANEHGRKQRALQEAQRKECMSRMDSAAHSISPTEEKVAAFCNALKVLQKHARALRVFSFNAKLHRMGHQVEEHGILYEGAKLQVFYSLCSYSFHDKTTHTRAKTKRRQRLTLASRIWRAPRNGCSVRWTAFSRAVATII
jgi:hypothetical protein